MHLKSFMATTVAAGISASFVCGMAGAATITADRADAIINTERSSTFISETVAAGRFLKVGHNNIPLFNVASDQASVAPFRLPTRQLRSAELTFTANRQGSANPDYAVDLYGLDRISADPTVLQSDYFEGENDPDATKLADAFVSGEISDGDTFSLGGDPLVEFLNGKIAEADGEAFVFFRLSPDQDPVNNGTAFTFDAADADTLGTTPPTLEVAAVPLPSAFAGQVAAGSVLLGVGAWRRRRRPA